MKRLVLMRWTPLPGETAIVTEIVVGGQRLLIEPTAIVIREGEFLEISILTPPPTTPSTIAERLDAQAAVTHLLEAMGVRTKPKDGE